MVLLFLTLPAYYYLLKPGLPNTQDGEYYLIRIAALHRTLRDFQIPPRFDGYLNHTYGYPVLNFLYPLFYYLGEIFYLSKFSLVLSTKACLILSFLFSAFFMYLFCQEFFTKIPSLFASMLYTYFPYRFTDVYIRGSFGEALTFVFVPLVFWATIRLLKTNDKKYLALGSLSIASLIMSHNVMALLFIPIIFVFILLWSYQQRQKRHSPLELKNLIALLFLSLGLSCFFWLPAVYEIKYTIFSQTRVSTFFDYFPKTAHLFWPFLKNLPPAPGFEDASILWLGPLLVPILLISLLIIKKRKDILALSLVCIIFFCLFLMNPASTFLWKIKSIHQLVQFPWRLLSMICFVSAFLGGYTMSIIKNKKTQIILFLILTILLIITNKNNLKPKNYLFRDDNFYFTNDSTTVTQNEYLPKWVKNPPTQAPPHKIETNAHYQIINQKSNFLEFTTLSQTPESITVNTVYYPGWNLTINNQKAPINYLENGLIKFQIPQGKAKIVLKFSETPLRYFSDIITIIAALFLIPLMFLPTSKEKINER